MKYLFTCRRTFIAFLAIACLTLLGFLINSVEVSYPIASIAIGIATANAYEGARKKG